MKDSANILPAVFTTSMTGITALLGGWDKALSVFVICVVIDMITGVMKGFALKEFSTKRMRQGFLTKVGYFIVIILATQFDKLMPDEMPILRTVAIYFYIYCDGLSVLENLGQMGVPIPKALIDRMSVFQEKGGIEKDEKSKTKNDDSNVVDISVLDDREPKG